MAEPQTLRQQERDLAARAKREEDVKRARATAARARGQQVLSTYNGPDTVSGSLYDAIGDKVVAPLNRLFGASERDAARRGRAATDAVRSVAEFAVGPEEIERSVYKIAKGNGDASDFAMAALAVAPAALRKPAGKLIRAGKRAAGAARETRVGQSLTRSRPIEDASRPLFDVKTDGPHLMVQRRDLVRETQPEARNARSLNDLRRDYLSKPETNPALRAASAASERVRGVPLSPDDPMPKTSLARQAGIGRAYRAAVEGTPGYEHAVYEAYGNAMPEVVERSGAQNYSQLTEAAYNQLGKEVDQQFDDLPLGFRYHYGDAEYPAPSAMMRDVIGNGNLNVFRGGDPHEFLNKLDPQTGLNQNEKFRAAHDYIGHVAPGSTFRADGEEIAYAMHNRTMSPLAQMALLSETRGQNSLVNYSPLNADITGGMNMLRRRLKERGLAERLLDNKIPSVRADAERVLAEMPPASELNARLRDLGAQTQYAPQRAVLLPPDYLDPMTPGGMPDYLRPLLKPGGVDARGVHISRAEGLDRTDPTLFGTGHRGQEYRGVKQLGLPDRTYFYSGPEGTVVPEVAVTEHFSRRGIPTHAYEADLRGLYDLQEDPEGLLKLARAYNLPDYEPQVPFYMHQGQGIEGGSAIPDLERLVRDYGYAGYLTDMGPQRAAALYDPVEGLRAIERGPNGYAEGGLVETD